MGKNKFLNSAYNTLSELSERDGNQLKKVTDYCDELTYAGAMDFKDRANEHVEYTWDANGNMTSDLNKGLTEIQYNVLNLPEKITHSDGHITYITYAANGRKLRVTYKIDPTATIEPGEPFLPHGSISPLGQQIMANGLDRGDIQHPIDDPIGRPGHWSGALRSQGVGGEDDSDGHTRSEGGTEFLYYFHKDHLGSSMLLTDGTGSISRQVEYLPYGEVFLEKLHSSDPCCISL